MSKVFISYSHKASGPAWKDRLLARLDVLVQHDLIDAWHDEHIPGGSAWDREIGEAISRAEVAVILLTQEALESTFIIQKELVPLRHRSEHEGISVIPILCTPCAWRDHDWLPQIQVRPFEANPLCALSDTDADRAMSQIALEIANLLAQAARRRLPKPPLPLSSDRVFLSRLPRSQTRELVGREQDLALLDLAFAHTPTSVVSIVAWGGVGKTVLVQHWLNRMQSWNWLGIRRVYAWSFYSQGTSESRQSSEDAFLAHALAWFGASDSPAAPPWEKGNLLADAVAREPSLLVLDGLEPLQYPPGPLGGQLRAAGTQALLLKLATVGHPGLCIITSRARVTDLGDFERTGRGSSGGVAHIDLSNLSEQAGAHLLYQAGACRAGDAKISADDQELLQTSQSVRGHALTLHLLGSFLRMAYQGDIRKRELVKLDKAATETTGSTAFNVMAAYERWLSTGGESGRRQLAVLRLLSLFDGPADSDCLGAMIEPPAIRGLTDPLIEKQHGWFGWPRPSSSISETDWNIVVSNLETGGLVTVSDAQPTRLRGFDEATARAHLAEKEQGRWYPLGDPQDFAPTRPTPLSGRREIDTHPLLREYFELRLRDSSRRAWRKGHKRLYEYLRDSTPYWPEGLEGLQPLYQAVRHGCDAGRWTRTTAYMMDYYHRINRERYYSTIELGAYGTDLSVLAGFFQTPWSQTKPFFLFSGKVVPGLLSQAGHFLRAVGRLIEAEQPIRRALGIYIAKKEYKNAATSATSYAQLLEDLGRLSEAEAMAKQAVSLSDRSGDVAESSATRAVLAHVLHQAGKIELSVELFGAARALDKHIWLLGYTGYHANDLDLSEAERATWQKLGMQAPLELISAERSVERHLSACQEVIERAKEAQTYLRDRVPIQGLLERGLAHLAAGRANIYQAALSTDDHARSLALEAAATELDHAVHGLRHTGMLVYVPLGLLARAECSFLLGRIPVMRRDLEEAQQIATRGPMWLCLADVHLHRARFFRDRAELKAARALIEKYGYGRRKGELEDAEALSSKW